MNKNNHSPLLKFCLVISLFANNLWSRSENQKEILDVIMLIKPNILSVFLNHKYKTIV